MDKKVNLEKIKQLRKQRKLSLLEMSRQLGYSSPNGYFYLETGRIRFSAETLAKLADIFEVQISELFFDHQIANMANDQDYRLTQN